MRIAQISTRYIRGFMERFFPPQANWMSEMSQGLAEDLEGTPADAAQTDSSAPMIDGSSAEAVAAAADADADAVCVRPTKPKTLKQKRKFRLHKLREIRRLRIKDKKKRMAQVDRCAPILSFSCVTRLI